MGPVERSHHRILKLEAELWPLVQARSLVRDGPFPTRPPLSEEEVDRIIYVKPKWMRWGTYEKKMGEVEAAETARVQSTCRDIESVLARIRR